MLRIDFDILAAEVPDCRQAWTGLREWFRRNPRACKLDLQKLAHDLPEVPTRQLALALTELATRRLIRPVYYVLTSDGYVLDGEFDSPKDVPRQLPDRLHHAVVDTGDANIILGYRVESGCVK